MGGFVPKPHTPFQWFGRIRRRRWAQGGAAAGRGEGDEGPHHPLARPEASVAEGLASRGDRRIGAVIERVWRAGGTFQEWSEHFDLWLWEAAMTAEGLTVEEVCTDLTEDEALPWDHISAGLHRDFLWEDWLDVLARVSRDCRWTPCYDCGVCTGGGLKHVVASPCPGRREPGHRPGPGPGDGSRCAGRPRFLTARGVSARFRYTKRGRSGSPATGTSPGYGSVPCGAAACPSPGRRDSCLTPAAQFWARPAHRVRVAGRVPRRPTGAALRR